MKVSNFTVAQKAFIIMQSEEGTPVAEERRKAGISPATYFQLEEKTCRPAAERDEQLKQLEDDNSRLKKKMADLTLDREILQDQIGEKSEAWSGARRGSRDVQRLGGVDPDGLWRHRA